MIKKKKSIFLIKAAILNGTFHQNLQELAGNFSIKV
jgi:hypothetical protein